MPVTSKKAPFIDEIPIKHVHPDLSDDTRILQRRTEITELVRLVLAKHAGSREDKYGADYSG